MLGVRNLVGFIKFLVITIISQIIFNPIDKKYKFRSRYHNHLNKRFRLFIVIIGLLSSGMELFIGFLSDNYLKSLGTNRNLISFIFGIPLLFVLLVGMPFSEDK